MRSAHILLTRQQWIGIISILLILSGIFVGLHFLPQPEAKPITNTDSIEQQIVIDKKAYYDSLHKARMAHYDSLRQIRRDSLHQVYQAHNDSMRQIDSLWWDSVYNHQPRAVKKDTIIELNSADTTHLKLIRGIGSNMARRIVRYRQQLGGFTHVEQLLDNQLYMDQYGHSIRSKYCLPDSILPQFFVCLDSVKSIPVNRSSIERLQSHPYISHTLAKEIYNLRREQIKLNSIDEIRDLPHMTDSLLLLITPYLSFEK